MSLPGNIRDRDYNAYTELNGETLRHVLIGNDNSKSIPIVNKNEIIWDEINVTFPANNQELFTYLKESLVVLTVLVTYLNSNKKQIVNIVKTIL